MSIQSQLDALRMSQAGCRVAAYGDLASRLILRSSSDTPCPRETLDHLVNRIASGVSFADSVQLSNSGPSSAVENAFIVFTSQDTVVSARSGEDGNDVVCAVLDAAQNLEDWHTATAQTAVRIDETEE